MQRSGRRWVTVLVVVGLLAGACTSGDDDEADGDPAEEPGFARTTDGPLQVRLSAGEPATATEPDPVAVVGGEPLDESRIEEILARLPELAEEDGDRQELNLPPQTPPPPRVGPTIQEPFPAPGDLQPAEAPSGPLQVLRVQPEGEVDLAPFVAVTFDQPMVPLSTLDQLDQQDVPVAITPDLPGRWRWIGSRTVRFEHDPEALGGGARVDRMPMATEYTVEIPAGTTSETGGELADAVTFTFRTPPVRAQSISGLTSGSPADGRFLTLEPVFVATFDQVIDPDAVVDHLVLHVDDQERAVRLATEQEVEADTEAREAVAAAAPGRSVAFRPTEPLPTDAAVAVELPEGLPSAEGPLVTAEAQRFSGRTYPALEVERTECSWDTCRPGTALVVVTTTELDTEAFDPSTVTVDPELPGQSIQATGNRIAISGLTRSDQSYDVTVPGGLRDVFGQTLGDDETVTFEIGDALPMLRGPDGPIVTLDPFAPGPRLPIATIGHDEVRVRTFDVEPADWPGFLDYVERWDRRDIDDLPPWAAISDDLVPTDAEARELGETMLDLSEAVGGTGHAVVAVESTLDLDPDSQEMWENRPILVWVQRTSIGLDAVIDGDRLVAWSTDLADGTPLAGVELALAGTDATARTDTDGLAVMDVPEGLDHLEARVGDDTAILGSFDLRYAERSTPSDTARWHVFDDRGLYRPGEQARLKGWVRRLTLSADAQLAPVDGNVAWTAYDGFGNEIGAGEAPLSAAGGFDLAVDIPAEVAVGQGWVELHLVGEGLPLGSATHQLHIAEFRRPEFEVRARAESPGPYLVTDPATVAVTAEYLSGGLLPDAPVRWTVRTRPGTYAPPGWNRFTFGIWTPWWFESGRVTGGAGFDASSFEGDVCCFPGGEEEIETFDGRTDATGTHYLRMDFDGAPEGQPVVVSANGAVTDVNRQQLADTTELLVHAAARYVGLRTDRTFVDAGDAFTTEVIATDIDGEVVAGQEIDLVLERLEWRETGEEWEEVGVEVDTCTVTTGEEPVSCELTPPSGGTHRIVATITDDAGGTNRTELTRWVAGRQEALPDRDVEQEELTLVPDAETYGDGDTARVLVQSPIPEGTGMVTIARNGIREARTFPVADGSAIIEVPITDDLVPGVDLLAEVVGTGEPERPAFAVGTVRLDVPPTDRTIDVTVTPADPELTPGDDTTVEITVTDASGAPVEGAELAVVVVDEAVLSLTDHELSDPLDSMYAPFDRWLTQLWGRSTVVVDAPERPDGGDDSGAGADGDGEESAFSADSAGGSAEGEADFANASRSAAPDAAPGQAPDPAIDVRTNFDALAVFAPAVSTDADGRAVVDVPLPDNLTRYRAMVTASAGVEDFGIGEANITARLPVQARPSAPRFLNFGDQLEVPVVVQNQTDETIEADVVLQTTNLDVTGDRGVRVEVPANDRVEVRFPAAAADVGTARLRAAVVAGENSDAPTVDLPVFTPATSEAFATYGVIDEGGVVQPLDTPEGVLAGFGGLEVSTSSTSLQTLTDAVIDLTEYRYDHVDALASRVLAIVALRDVLGAFDAEGLPSAQEIEATVAGDLAGIVRRQNGDGGFGTWRGGTRSDPYRSIQATHALVAARDAGYAVDEAATQAALFHLAEIEQHIPSEWPEEVKATLSAYALHVRDLAGDRDQGKADRLFDSSSDVLGVDGMAWLWPVVGDAAAVEIARQLDNRVTETPSAATFTTDYGEDAHLILASDRRTDGIVLDALIRMRPDSDLIPKVVTGLIGNQRKGSWGNVQENSFVLLALKSYFDAFEATTPDFVARIWLGDLYAAESAHRGRSTETRLTQVPMTELLERDDPALVVAKEGAGRLYYRLGLRYAPDDLTLDPRDEGFVVDRTYEAVDDPGDVQQRDDGTWEVRAGANVRVTVTMVADSRRTNMALVDPVPAGFEIVNPELATAVDIPAEEDPGGEGPPVPLTWWWGTWWDHQNQRDDRAEAFASFLPAGTYEYSYVARATTPGTFVTPPARAEEMYAPEVFGRSGSTTVVVADD